MRMNYIFLFPPVTLYNSLRWVQTPNFSTECLRTTRVETQKTPNSPGINARL